MEGGTPLKAINKIVDVLTRILDVISMVFMTLMVIFLLIQLISRAFFNYSLFWTEESARICLIMLAYIGSSVSSVSGNHVSITILGDSVRPLTAKKIIYIVQQLIAIAFLVLLFFFSFPAIEIASKSVTTNTQINYALIYSIIPVTCVISSFGHIAKIIKCLLSKSGLDNNDEDINNVLNDNSGKEVIKQ